MTTEREQIVSEYNTNIIKVLSMAGEQFADDADILDSVQRLKERMILAKQADYEVLVKLSGPYIFQYQDMIKRRDLSDFTEDMLNAEIAKRGKQDKAEVVFKFFGIARRLYESLDSDEIKKLFSKLDILLQNYLKYCIITG